MPLPLVVTTVSLAGVGVLSNAATLSVIWTASDFTRTKSGLLIAQQTSIDLLSSLLFVVTHVVLLTPGDVRGVWGEVFCRVIKTQGLLWLCLKASTLNLLNISFERYLQVVRPIYHRQRFTRTKTFLLMTSAWLGSTALNLPLFVACFADDAGFCNFAEGPLGSIKAQFAYGLAEFLAVYLLPFVLMTFFYGRMLSVINTKLVRSNTPTRGHYVRQSSNSGQCLSTAQVNLVKTFLLVSLLYVVCWTPTQLYCLLFGLRSWIDLPFPTPFHDAGYAVAMTLTVFNLCVNPVVYACKLQVFRARVIRIFACSADQARRESFTPSAENRSSRSK
jgi:hypothetical protein